MKIYSTIPTFHKNKLWSLKKETRVSGTLQCKAYCLLCSRVKNDSNCICNFPILLKGQTSHAMHDANLEQFIPTPSLLVYSVTFG